MSGAVAAAPPTGGKPSKSHKSSTRKGVAVDANALSAAAASAAYSGASAAATAAPAHTGALSAAFPSSALPRFVHPLHRCRFLTFLPHSIISLAFSPSGRLLALGRSNGNIELWAVGANAAQAGSHHGASAGANGWAWLKTIPGSGEPTVQVLLWARGGRGVPERLFSAGLNGRLIEWDLQLLAPKHASHAYGGAVWSGAIHSRKTESGDVLTIALGCEDGTIRLFDVSDAQTGPLYSKALSRHSSRVLSVCWSPDGNLLASGGADGMIKLFDLINDGRNVLRITVENKGLRKTTLADTHEEDRHGKKKKGSKKTGERYETMVWSVLFLSGSTLASGDSLGNVQVWELEFGTLRQSFAKVLQGDVLCMATSKNRDVLYASGVEGKIVELKRVASAADADIPAIEEINDDANAKWVLTANHRQHTHDVYAFAISPNTLPLPIKRQLGSPKLGPSASPAATPLPNNFLLVSGGVDTQLLLSPTTCFPDFSSLTRLMPFPQASGGVVVADQVTNTAVTAESDEDEEEGDASESSSSSASLPPRFLVVHDQHVQLYSLGSVSSASSASAALASTGSASAYIAPNAPAGIDKVFSGHAAEHDPLALDKAYTHLLDINVNSRKSVDTSSSAAAVWVPGGGLNLLCASLSPDSRFVACSDPIQVKLYELRQASKHNVNNIAVRKIKQVHAIVQPASVMAFSADSSRLFLGTLGGAVQVVDLAALASGEGGEDAVQTLDAHVPPPVYEGDLSSGDEDDEQEEDEAMDGAVGGGAGSSKKRRLAASSRGKSRAQQLGVLRNLVVSSDQQYLAVSDELNHVWVYDLDALRLVASLPSFATPVLDLAFHPGQSTVLAILCARNVLHLYDVEQQGFTPYSKANLGALALPTSVTGGAHAHVSLPGGNVLAPAGQLLAREQFTHLSFDRASASPAGSLLLHSLNLVMHINLALPRPPQGPTQLLTGAAAQSALQNTHLNRRDRKRKAEAAAAASAGEDGADASLPFGGAAASAVPVDPRQVNFRVLTRFRPLLHASFVADKPALAAATAAAAATNATVTVTPAAAAALAATPVSASGEGRKKRKKDSSEDAASAQPDAESATGGNKSGERPVHVGSSLLVIEAPWVNILQQLPQPLARHRYGT